MGLGQAHIDNLPGEQPGAEYGPQLTSSKEKELRFYNLENLILPILNLEGDSLFQMRKQPAEALSLAL